MGKKATFVIDDRVIEKAKEIVDRGDFKSLNSFVEAAMRDEIEKLRKEELKKALSEASTDPLFLADIKEVERDFEHADFEEERQ